MLYSVEIGKKIVMLRKAKNLTQKELAKKAGISISRLRDVEHGRANSCLNTLESIADALDTHLLCLLLADDAADNQPFSS